MSDIEYNLVFRGIEHVMQPHNQFHGPKAGAEMSGIGSTTFYYILTDFGAESGKLTGFKTSKVLRGINILQHNSN